MTTLTSAPNTKLVEIISKFIQQNVLLKYHCARECDGSREELDFCAYVLKTSVSGAIHNFDNIVISASSVMQAYCFVSWVKIIVASQLFILSPLHFLPN